MRLHTHGMSALLLLSACAANIEGDAALECEDAVDNDQDGLFDCDDPDCAGSPDCTQDGTGGTGPGAGGTGPGTGGGSGSGTGGTGPGTGSGSGTGGWHSGGSGTGGPCLDIGTLTFDAAFTWDSAAGQTTSFDNPFSGSTDTSVLKLNFGPSGWSGDTTLPGPPDNWCFVQFNLDGAPNVNTDPSWWLEIEGVSAASGTTNCGRDSAPGAGDRVDLCGGFFGGADPVAQMASSTWSQIQGGDIDPAIAGFPSYFPAAYGYSDDTFWGSELRSDLFATDAATLTYGWRTDASGDVVLDGNNLPVLILNTEADAGNGLTNGHYQHVVPWIFTF